MLRDALVVAGYELADAIRSRRVVVLALLYVGGAVAGTASGQSKSKPVLSRTSSTLWPG